MLAYLAAISVTAGLYALMALGVNLTWGMTGMINLGLAGFFAVGGYTTALLTKSGAAIPVGVLAGGAMAAATGAVVALVTARLRADYLAIVTLGFSESIRIAASNEIWLTNGSDGIAGIPGPWRGAVSPMQFNLLFLTIVALVLATVFLLLHRLGVSPFGRVLRAIRDDEDLTAVAGKHVLVFAQDSAFGQANVAAVRAVLGAEGASVDGLLAPLSANDFTPFAQKVKDTKPDLLFIAWAGTTGASMFKSLDDAVDVRRALAHDGARQRPLIEISDGVLVVPDRIHAGAGSARVGELLRCYARTASVAV